MNWTVLSVAACIALTIKLLFFTNTHRSESRWIYRVMLFMAAVYAGKQVIWSFYFPDYNTNPFIALFHVGLFIGSLVIQPQYLPWNIRHDAQHQTLADLARAPGNLLRWFRHTRLHRQQGSTSGNRR